MNITSPTYVCFVSECGKQKLHLENIEDLNLPPITSKPFYFLRHGQTDLNLERRHQGQQNNSLNETGKKQALQAGLTLSNYEINSICSSPLLRAKQTSEIISKYTHSDIHYFEDLKERFKGQAEGRLYKECNFSNTFTHMTNEEPFGAESNKNFLNRIVNVINQALEMPSPALIVTHGAVLCCLCFYLKIALPNNIERSNCLPLLFSPTLTGWEVKVIS